MTRNARRFARLITRLRKDHPGVRFRRYSGYSGRGMGGQRACYAVVCDCSPASPVGEELVASGLSCDALGRSIVYYSRETIPQGSGKPFCE